MRAAARTALAIALVVCACRKGEAVTETPNGAAAGAGAHDPLVSLEQKLDEIDARMSSAGLPVPTGAKAPAKTGAQHREPAKDGNQCETRCELKAAACELRTRVCDLAAEHEDDPRYADACARAEEQCRVATEACEACSSA